MATNSVLSQNKMYIMIKIAVGESVVVVVVCCAGNYPGKISQDEMNGAC